MPTTIYIGFLLCNSLCDVLLNVWFIMFPESVSLRKREQYPDERTNKKGKFPVSCLPQSCLCRVAKILHIHNDEFFCLSSRVR